MANSSDTDYFDEIQRFGWADYLVFAGMLLVSAVIGVYYAWYELNFLFQLDVI